MNAQEAAERKNVERIFARVFTVIGGIFWIGSAFMGPYVYQGVSVLGAFATAVYPLAFTIAVLAIGWFYERLAALILALGVVGTLAWGFISGWDPFLWGIMLTFFVAPTVISAVLFYLAGNEPASESEGATAA